MDAAQLFVKMALHSWEVQVKRAGNLFNSLTEEQLLQEIAPGRNRGVYLLGHLVAVDDGMLPLLGLGDRLYPELDEAFLKNPDRSGIETPSISDLKLYWSAVHNKLAEEFSKLTPESWMQRHTAMTEEDWVKEPHRNKLSVLLNRTGHLAYHLGQLTLIRK